MSAVVPSFAGKLNAYVTVLASRQWIWRLVLCVLFTKACHGIAFSLNRIIVLTALPFNRKKRLRS